MLDVATAIDSFARPATRYRRAAGAYSADGDWIAGVETSTDIAAAFQPLKGRELRDLPEGIRDEATHRVYTRDAVQNGDEITQDGSRYRVLRADPRPLGAYSFAIAGLLA